MRLSKIKLAGFKSFVDPTTITFPSPLVGVVGPNGCGKSNVIDAVRWVMGESSASRLRGDSITDVIFNGSSSRQPVGAASVELLFDNSETTLEGQYAKYAEIAIRREVTRDGLSTYFLNGTRCRRKDITGVFLGTGLGARSYSIIEQGMISRLIEAKPEDLRVFLEEAAGISKYKERRRETSNRIRHTKENLDRLRDVLEEVDKQIKHLDRQAKMAERYGRYKAEERRTAAELLALQAQRLDMRGSEAERLLAEQRTGLEAVIAEQRSLEARLEETRLRHTERNDEFNTVQGRYYRIGSEIARFEQAIDHAHDLRMRQLEDLEQAQETARETREHIEQDETQIQQLEVSMGEMTPGLEQAQARQAQSEQSLADAEEALSDWQAQWDHCAARLGDAEQTRNVEKTRSEDLESRLRSFGDRLKKLEDTRLDSDRQALKAELDDLTEKEQRARDGREECDRQIRDLNEKIRKLRDQDGQLSRLVDERQSVLQAAQEKFASLEALQKAALGESDGMVQEWLAQAGLDKNARLAQSIEVEDPWERAVETVLGNYLQAVCVDDIDAVTESIGKLGSGSLTVLEHSSEEDAGTSPESFSLAEKTRLAPASIRDRLGKVRCADTLSEALARRDSLGNDESIVTADGIWIGRHWLRVARSPDGESGVLSREQELRDIKAEVAELKGRFEGARKLLVDGRNRLSRLEEQREETQQKATAVLARHSDFRAALDTARYRLDQADARQDALSAEAAELDQDLTAVREQLGKSRQTFEQACQQTEQLQVVRAALEEQRDELRDELQRVRTQAGHHRQAVQALSIEFESRRSTKNSAAQGLERMRAQLGQFQLREQNIREQLESSEAPLLDSKQRLESLLTDRVDIEKDLASARLRVEEIEEQLRELDQVRLDVDRRIDAAREGVSQAEIAFRELRVRREGYSEQLEQTEFEIETLIDELEDDATISGWEEKLERVRRRIERLGPINLAAIDEFKEQSDRKLYLDAQLEDLTNALATLENAIRKIDRETRNRFRETYTNVNEGFKKLFPKLFGGGHAYLELTGDDLLSAGVTVMARPPGKRNSTIHLLSGGEKALSAVALVFAIFELNPAPFCLLDEVDAPLDDANVARFCDIVRSMSEKVQFVFITHNKVTMELARQLTGVTMQEPGVSRLVSVDLDEAVKMAAS